MLLFMREYGGVRHRRSDRSKRNGFDHFVLNHVLSGELIGGAYGSAQRIAPGESLLLDTAKPIENGARSAKLITVSLKRDAMRAAAGNLSGIHGYRIGVKEGALLSTMLQALVDQASHLPPGAYAAVTRIVVDRLSVAINPGGTGSRSDFHRLEYIRHEAAVVIEANLCQPDFSVQDIVSATGIARSHWPSWRHSLDFPLKATRAGCSSRRSVSRPAPTGPPACAGRKTHRSTCR